MKILARLAKEIRAGRSQQTHAQTLKTHAFFKGRRYYHIDIIQYFEYIHIGTLKIFAFKK